MTSKPVFDIKTSTYKLSIQLSLNGFSFCIASNENKIITFFEEKLEENHYNEQELLEKLKFLCSTKPELQANFETVEFIFQNELFTFVPLEYFDEENPKEYLKYSVKTLATDFIAHDILPNTEVVNVFIPYVNINNYMVDTFGEFNYQHSSGLLTQYAINKSTSDQEVIYLNVNQQQFDICVVKNKKLLLFNSFIKSNNEDVLYYLLFCMEQLELSTEKIPVKILSTVPDDLFNLLYTYIRYVEKTSNPENNLLHKLALNIP